MPTGFREQTSEMATRPGKLSMLEAATYPIAVHGQNGKKFSDLLLGKDRADLLPAASIVFQAAQLFQNQSSAVRVMEFRCVSNGMLDHDSLHVKTLRDECCGCRRCRR